MLYTEPYQLKISSNHVRKIASHFDLILTNDENLLDLSNVKLMLFGGTWVRDVPKRKYYNLSWIYSAGIGFASKFSGYGLREIIWDEQNKINMPKEFYTSNIRPPNVRNLNIYPYENKDYLFDSMFSLAVENESERNYFTEKIIDCFKTYTVPIYYGSPNIGNYFNLEGILVVRDFSEIKEIANKLKPEDYWGRMVAMHQNYLISRNYWDILENLKRSILSFRDT